MASFLMTWSLTTSAALPSVLSASPDVLGAALGGTGRSRLVWDVLRVGGDPFTHPPEQLGRKARLALSEQFEPPGYRVVQRSVASCGTTKLLLALPKGDEIETVLIPSDGFSTLCVSSQVGCRQACSFCLTGTMGLRRSLEVDEIVSQVHAAMGEISSGRAALPSLRNVVFMGMGEPADNLDSVHAALEAMVHAHGFGLAKRHVCVSTVGPTPHHIHQLTQTPARLAWSAHAATDELRQLLVPTTRHTMVELRDAWATTLAARHDRGLMVEVTAIDGVNDGAEDAEALAALLLPLPGKTVRCRATLLRDCRTPTPLHRCTAAPPHRRTARHARTVERSLRAVAKPLRPPLLSMRSVST